MSSNSSKRKKRAPWGTKNSRDGGITFQTMEKHVKSGADLNSGRAAFGVVDVLFACKQCSNITPNLSRTTTPRTGFNARLAIPVLNALEVISKIAVPVVSEPVPAVVGTAMSGLRVCLIGSPFPTGALMKSKRSES